MLKSDSTIDYIYGGIHYMDTNDKVLSLVKAKQLTLKELVNKTPGIYQPGSFLKNHLQIKLDFLNPTGVVLITNTFCAVFPSMQNLYAANFLYPAFDITVIQKQDLSFPFLSGNNLTLVRITDVLISVS
ncbi:MAG: hypothetical protein IPG90_04775 [Bacteroidetes bacterium]|nr:hypothetical protein [Bacteroidota bacterium]